jgi:phage terminase small subunit
MSARKLTARQRAFIDEYVLCRNATLAAKNAGYSPKTARHQGSVLLTNPHIQAAIGAIQATEHTAAVATFEESCERLTDILRGEDDGAAIRAIERLSKLKGWDQPTRAQVEATTITQAPDLSKLSDKELATMERLLTKTQAAA